MKKIGMIVAMDKELKEYFNKLGNVKVLSDSVYSVWTAEAYGKQLFIVKSTIFLINSGFLFMKTLYIKQSF